MSTKKPKQQSEKQEFLKLADQLSRDAEYRYANHITVLTSPEDVRLFFIDAKMGTAVSEAGAIVMTAERAKELLRMLENSLARYEENQ